MDDGTGRRSPTRPALMPAGRDASADRGRVSCEPWAEDPAAARTVRGDSVTRPPRRFRLLMGEQSASATAKRRVRRAGSCEPGSGLEGGEPGSERIDGDGAEVVVAVDLEVVDRYALAFEEAGHAATLLHGDHLVVA